MPDEIVFPLAEIFTSLNRSLPGMSLLTEGTISIGQLRRVGFSDSGILDLLHRTSTVPSKIKIKVTELTLGRGLRQFTSDPLIGAWAKSYLDKVDRTMDSVMAAKAVLTLGCSSEQVAIVSAVLCRLTGNYVLACAHAINSYPLDQRDEELKNQINDFVEAHSGN